MYVVITEMPAFLRYTNSLSRGCQLAKNIPVISQAESPSKQLIILRRNSRLTQVSLLALDTTNKTGNGLPQFL